MSLKWLPLLIAATLMAIACGGGGDSSPTPSPAPSPAAVLPSQTPEATPKAEPTPAGPGPGGPPPREELTAEEELLAAAALTMEDVAEVFPGREWRTIKASQQLISEGQRAAWVAVQESQGGEVVTTELRMYETVNGASDAMQGQIAFLIRQKGAETATFDVGDIGDEAEVLVSRPPDPFSENVSTMVFLRVDTVMASVGLAGSDTENREEIRQLAENLVEKIEAVIQG